jgi:hypothetical protein
MWRSVDLVWTDVSEERIASIYSKNIVEEFLRNVGLHIPCRWMRHVLRNVGSLVPWRWRYYFAPKRRSTLPWRCRRYVPPKRRFTHTLKVEAICFSATSVHITLKMAAIRPPKRQFTLPWRWRRYVPPKRRFTHTLKMEAIRSSETSIHRRSTRRHIPEDGILHSHRRENLKSYFVWVYFVFV